ncbi:MAG TPA: protein sphX [Candidatus Omnitrophica bacterium]|nr:MAG: protein sphX [Omnitrophica WOR_2 bacterium GWA2_45_18]HBR14490.1 protein sphX [Candidatus Omnitrophota bacterium]
MNKFTSVLLSGLMLFGFQSGMVQAAEPIKIDGSSTIFPITEAVAEEFGKKGGAKAMVGISGTGGGFKRFCRGETDISNASRPIKQKEIDACREGGVEYLEFQVAYDGLSVVVNPANYWVDYLTVAELKSMWDPSAQNTITQWSQIRTGFPDKKMELFGPGTDSGTFDYFTEAINGKSGSSRGDYTASEDDNVLVTGISGNPNAVGYFGLAYYEQNKSSLKIVPIKEDAGKDAVVPSRETVMDGSYRPLSRPLFIYVSRNSLKNKPAVKSFTEFYLRNASILSEEVGYISLPEQEYQRGLQHLENL